MSLEKFYIPKHLDDAPKFLLWSIDEAMSFIVPLFIGVMMNMGVVGVIVAIATFKMWKKIKGTGGGSNLIKCIIYWYYPCHVLGLKATPDSSIKSYIA